MSVSPILEDANDLSRSVSLLPPYRLVLGRCVVSWRDFSSVTAVSSPLLLLDKSNDGQKTTSINAREGQQASLDVVPMTRPREDSNRAHIETACADRSRITTCSI